MNLVFRSLAAIPSPDAMKPPDRSDGFTTQYGDYYAPLDRKAVSSSLLTVPFLSVSAALQA